VKSKNFFLNEEIKLINADSSYGKLNLLLVEDDDVNAKIILRFLDGEYNAQWIKSGSEAVELALKKKFDGFLMDISLKGSLDGMMTTSRIREIAGYESTPIIAVTAYAMVGDKEKFLNGGCTDYISKPFSKSELLLLLKNTFS
jgi:CheY-like chemotaxis protein